MGSGDGRRERGATVRVTQAESGGVYVAGDALDLLADKAVDDAGQVGVEPFLQHGAHQFAHQVLDGVAHADRPAVRMAAAHAGETGEGGGGRTRSGVGDDALHVGHGRRALDGAQHGTRRLGRSGDGFGLGLRLGFRFEGGFGLRLVGGLWLGFRRSRLVEHAVHDGVDVVLRRRGGSRRGSGLLRRGRGRRFLDDLGQFQDVVGRIGGVTGGSGLTLRGGIGALLGDDPPDGGENLLHARL